MKLKKGKAIINFCQDKQAQRNSRLIHSLFDEKKVDGSSNSNIRDTYHTGYFTFVKCFRSKGTNATIETTFYQSVVHTELIF